MYHLHHICISLEIVLKRCMVCMTACEYMACMLLSPCCQDDYFLCSVILPVPSIPCLDSSIQLCVTLVSTFRMSQGTRGQLGRNQGRGNDQEEGNLPPPPTMDQVLMEVERNHRDSHQLLEVIAHNTTQQHNELVSLNDFIRLHPPVFSYSTEPLDADDWLRSIERKLQEGHVADGDKVSYATYHLEGAASSWWENFLNMHPAGPPTTWVEFCTSFREHHIPKGLMDRKREEFCNLTQGRRTVDEFSREFNRLARYATEEVSTDAKKQERFRRGLNSGLRRELNLHDFATFQVLVNKAIKAEDMNNPNDFRKHPRDDSSSSSGPQKRKIWIPNSMFRQNNPPRPSYVAPRPPAPESECPPPGWRQQLWSWQAPPEGLHHQARSSRHSWTCESDCRRRD